MTEAKTTLQDRRLEGTKFLTFDEVREHAGKTKITDIDAMIAGALADPQAQEEPVLIAALQAAARAVRDQTSAAWWIDRRDSSARSLVRDMARGQ